MLHYRRSRWTELPASSRIGWNMRVTEHSLPAVIGYVTPLSAKPGETLEFKISSLGDRDVAAKVVRLDCCDPNPLGPGLKSVDVEFGLKQRYPAREQQTHLGSCAIGPIPTKPEFRELTVELIVKPTLFSSLDQTIFSLQNSDGSKGVALVLSDGALFLKRLETPQISDGLGRELRVGEWTKLEVVLGATGVSTHTSVIGTRKRSEAFASLSGLSDVLREVDHICFAAIWTGHPEDCFNGLIEAPRLYGSSQPGSDRAVLANWCFATSLDNGWVADEIDRSRRLALINMPMRAVRSSAWSGRNMDWKTAPQEYAAIAFHSDDLSDCKWDTTIAVDGARWRAIGRLRPHDREPGRHGHDPILCPPATRTCPGRELSFWRRPSPTWPMPTMRAAIFPARWKRGCARGMPILTIPMSSAPMAIRPTTAIRTGSGITLSSRLRPIMTMRPQLSRLFRRRTARACAASPADSHLTDWLTVKGFGVRRLDRRRPGSRRR